jgi:hypothetical protein
VGRAFYISQAVAVAPGLDSRDRRSLYACAVARGVANTRCSIEQECRYGVLRLLTLATLRLPDLAVYGELLHSQDGEGCSDCLLAQALIGASSGAMRLAHRALEMHSLDVGYRVDAWLERALDGACDELQHSVAAEGSPATLNQARLATLALTRATASTANEPMLLPGQIADALAHLLAIYVIAVEVASAT